ncbi:hypothetical protein NOR_01097 [Metarhizium rileyi]|uniref:Uncharacterized protein n=1 Tax=Metarhizium rileyi (strain RCEF 4871) TaxID=1649241 RepID=A0A167JRI4_METRR|nr:hypothetical protein NOR_01097 [Metarhizium rileyi RCEF 4871]
MHTTTTLSAILAASAIVRATAIASEPQITSTAVSPPSLSTGHFAHHGNGTVVTVPGLTTTSFPVLSTSSGSPVPSANSTGALTTGTGLAPVPTSSTTAVPTAGAALTTTKNSWLAMGVAIAMSSLIL